MEAVQFYIQHHNSTEDILASVAVEEMMESRKGYRKSTERRLRGTCEAFAAYEDLPMREYTRADIMEFCQFGELEASSRHGNHTRLGTFFNWAMRRGYVSANPCQKIKKKADLGVVPPRSITFFKYDEVERLMNTALETDPGMIPYLTLAIFCGIRPHELSGTEDKPPVTWDDILIDEDIAEVNVPSTSSKTREPRQIELNDNALEWLKLGGDLPPKNIRNRRDAIARKAGVNWSEDIMRHTFASYHCRMFRSPERLKLEMGHSENSKTLENHYRSGRCTLKDARKFWTLVPSGAQNIINPALSA
jgi:integrase